MHYQFSLQKEHTSARTIIPISISEEAWGKTGEAESSEFFFLPFSSLPTSLCSGGLSILLSPLGEELISTKILGVQ